MLKLYVTTDNENVINKTLQFKKEYPIKFKEQTNIKSPSITLKINDNFDLMGCNYCYITEFNRYYFIQEIQLVGDDLFRILLECDVLESFKDDILNSYGVIQKKVEQGEFVQFNVITDVRKDIEIYESSVSLIDEKNIILSAIGGG